METTVTIEFSSDTEEHLKMLEHQLKQIHDTHISLVEPIDRKAPALVAISINKGGARGQQAAQSVSHTLYNFLHEDPSAQSQKRIYLVTKEGDRVDIEPLSINEVEAIIVDEVA